MRLVHKQACGINLLEVGGKLALSFLAAAGKEKKDNAVSCTFHGINKKKINWIFIKSTAIPSTKVGPKKRHCFS